MNEIKPIKGSAQLQPLGWEHHDGLLFIWKIRQEINKPYKGWIKKEDK